MNESHNGERRRRSTTEWRQLITAQTNSGLSQREFCARESIPLGSFCNAKHRLQANGSARAESQSDFVSLLPLHQTSTSGWDIELSVGSGVTIRVRSS